MMRPIQRRDVLKVLGAATMLGVARAAGSLTPSSLDHVECWVSSAPASAAFYAGIFGNQVLKNQRTERRYVRLGSAYLAMDQGQAAHVDHICAGIPGFQIAEAHEYLAARSVAYRDYPSGRDTAVNEPGGQRIQLAADHGWDLLLTGTAAPETTAVTGEAVFTPVALESVLLRTPDFDGSARFLAQLFGDSSSTGAERWFRVGSSRLGVAASGVSGVEYLRITARPFDARSSLAALNRVGARQVTQLGPGEVEFTDPDGYRLRVAGA